MAAVTVRSGPSRLEGFPERNTKAKSNRTDIWTSLLKQTQVAQSRNRSNAVAHRQLVLCGGSAEEQRSFTESLTRPPPPQPLRRARNDTSEQRDKGLLALSNRYAYGYGHFSIFSAQQIGIGASTLGQDSEEVARVHCHCIPESDSTYESVLRRVLLPAGNGVLDDKDVDEDEEDSVQQDRLRPAVQVLLSWKEPWKFLRSLRAWLQLLSRSVLPAGSRSDDEDPVEVLKEYGISVTVVVQHVEAQQELEKEGWSEETFDYICQVLRTVLLPLHPHSALIYTPSMSTPQQPGSTLTELQKVVFSSMCLDLTALSPRPTSSGASNGAPVKKEDLQPRHNVVDRMNVVIPADWDSAGKVRLLSETFSPEEVLSAWSYDLSKSAFPAIAQETIAETQSGPQSTSTAHRPTEEVYQATSPISPSPSPPTSPTKTAPSAVTMFEARIVDPNAHKAPQAPTITVVTRPEQEFLKEMKVELDSYVVKDRERNASLATTSPPAGRVIGMPTGESSGALDNLGDVSFNVGGVSYNTISAEAAIERLKRPQLADAQSPSSSGSRAGTPRPPRRVDHDREGTPGATTPSSSKAEFPSEDLEKFFASMANKAGSGIASRQGTPSRQ